MNDGMGEVPFSVRHAMETAGLPFALVWSDAKGPYLAQWVIARILINGIVEDSRTDVEGRATSVDVRWDVSGELPGFGFKVRREVRAEDPKDPNSRLIYACQHLGEHDPSTETTLSENAMKLHVEVRKQNASESRPAKASQVRAVAQVDDRRASEARDQLFATGKVDGTRGMGRGKTFDVWLTDDEV